MAAASALVLGEALIDIVRQQNREAEHPGGSPMNVAVGLGRLGIPTTLATWFGADDRGAAIRRHCAASGVHLAAGSDAAGKTPTAIAVIDAAGQAEYTFDLAWELPPIPKALRPAVIHTGSIAAILEPGATGVLDAIRAGAQHATITYDPNMRPQIMGTAQSVARRVKKLIRLADVVKVSDDDLAHIFPGGDTIGRAAKVVREEGPAVLVVTRGSQGAVGIARAGLQVEVPPASTAVVDTVGAGDSFMSGLIWAMARADFLGPDRREALGAITKPQLRDLLAQASRVAAVTVGRAGADPPRLAELV